MRIHFFKYQGTGNDFILLDNMSGEYDKLSNQQIQRLCERKFGIGSDGLIKLNAGPEVDFEMEFFNPDGSKSFCGNGARCAVKFARHIGVIKNETHFRAIDGLHIASITQENQVRLGMNEVKKIEEMDTDFVLNTGSPHYVTYSKSEEEIVELGRRIRFSDSFKAEGINVNRVQKSDSGFISVETYERGVEDETLSCGTGVTACALVEMIRSGITDGSVNVKTKGGTLNVSAKRNGGGFEDIWLEGAANFVFEGVVEVL